MNKDMDAFYKKALKKILNFKASELSTVEFELKADELTIEEFTPSELSTVEFEQVKRNSEKLEVYRFVRRIK
ncbi:hypothetical protein [Fusobacterium polymorphum]|uniref:hypothetical protein n=1 Tax=Fusobacterium nucleatum subsp. polymorphum TaxID=76857 RepID=UPI00300A0574